MNRAALLVVLHVACASAPTPPPATPLAEATRPVSQAAPAVRACPPASAIRRVVVHRGERHWGIPLGYVEVPEGDDAELDAPSTAVDRAAVVATDLEMTPDVVWILRAGQPPCRAQISGYTSRLVADGPWCVAYEAITTDCEPPEGPVRGSTDHVWASDVEPAGECALHAVGRRREEALDGDTIPSAPAPVPAPYAAHVPPPESDWAEVSSEALAHAPALWSVRTAVGAPGISEVWVSHIVAEPGADVCDWYVHDYHALHRDDTGEMLGTYLDLDAVLVDDITRVVLIAGDSWSASHELDEGGLGLGRELEAFIDSGEGGTHPTMGPGCGP